MLSVGEYVTQPTTANAIADATYAEPTADVSRHIDFNGDMSKLN
jgi:hypothetical protein